MGIKHTGSLQEVGKERVGCRTLKPGGRNIGKIFTELESQRTSQELVAEDT